MKEGQEEFIRSHEGSILLENKTILFNNYGKYSPNICFLIKDPRDFGWRNISREELNLPGGSLEKISGQFFVSKKGTKCFKVQKEGPHMLVRDYWGGAFNKYRGGNLENLPDIIFSRRASSNGGGAGYDYVIILVGTRLVITEENI